MKIKKIIIDEIRRTYSEFDEFSDEAMDSMFFTRKNNIRLTYKGAVLMRRIFDSYVFKLDREKVKTKHLMTLTRKFTFPYYFGKSQMVLFNDEDATMMTLIGDPTRFLSAIEE